MGAPLALTRIPIARPEIGILRVVAAATVTIYDTLVDGTSPVTAAGAVTAGAVKSILYADKDGLTPKTNPMTADSQGLVDFYKESSTVHIHILAPDGTNYGIPWFSVVPSAEVLTDEAINVGKIKALDRVQVALDKVFNTSTGRRRLYLPMEYGPYIPLSPTPWNITGHVEIFGDGKTTGEDRGLQPFKVGGTEWKDSGIFKLVGESPPIYNQVYLHDLVMSSGVGYASGVGTGDYISANDVNIAVGFTMERCSLLYGGRFGVNLARSNYFVDGAIRDCNFLRMKSHGFYATTLAWFILEHNSFTLNHGMGMVLTNCSNGLSIIGNNWESNGLNLPVAPDADFPEAGTTYNSQAFLSGCQGVIAGGQIEDFCQYNVNAKKGLTLNNCVGMQVGGLEINNNGEAESVGTIGIYLINGTRNCIINPNLYFFVDTLVSLHGASGVKGNIIMPQISTINGGAGNTKGIVDVPAGQYNVCFVQNRNGSGEGIEDVVAIQMPGLVGGVTEIAAGVLKDGLFVYDPAAGAGANFQGRHGGAWKNLG